MGRKLTVFSWGMYDFANNIFAMNIISLYFALWVTVDKSGHDIFYSFSLAASMIASALAAPIVGIISDKLQRRMIFVIGFTLLSVIFTAFIGLIDSLVLGLLFFGIANFGYQIAATVYNALLPQIATKKTIGRISGYGKMLGYIGAIVGLILVRPFVDRGGRQWAFIPSAGFFLLFSLPCFIFIKEKATLKLRDKTGIGRGIFKMLKEALAEMQRQKALLFFLLAVFMAMNAISAIMVFMSVYVNKVVGLVDREINTFLMVSTLVAIFGCFFSGFITDRIGAKKTLCAILGLWCLTLIIASLAKSKLVFWFVGPLAGVVLGSTWVSSRALVVDLAPANMVAQIFGFFSLISAISAISGVLIWGGLVWSLGSLGVVKYRITCMSLVLFFLASLWLLRKVPNIIRK